MQDTRRSSLQIAMVLTQLVVLLLHSKSTEALNISKPGCPDSCGGVSIPYPFGIGNTCSMSKDFNISCISNNESNSSTPYLYNLHTGILNISLSLGQTRMNLDPIYKCYNHTSKKDDGSSWGYDFSNTSYWINDEKNTFAVFGCNTFAFLSYNTSDFFPFDTSYRVGCLSTCLDKHSLIKYGKSCSGVGCCKTAIPSFGTETFYLDFDDRYNNSEVYNISRCSYAMLIEDDPGSAFVFNTSLITTDELNDQSMPVVINWAIGNTTCKDAKTNKTSYACKSSNSECFNITTIRGVGYLCNCSDGYEGNPYIEGGCQDINECNATQNPCSIPAKCHNLLGDYSCSCPFGWRKVDHHECQLNLILIIGSIGGTIAGIVALLFLGLAMYVVTQRRNLSKIKEKYFQQNGGWILSESIKLNQGFGFTIFTKQQIEQATNNFDGANIIGHGGQGTVYKGTLCDQIVAIKKCKIASESQKKEFGKEMLILSQINHKNIVKLLGCCLEVEVPILVYEFISNGTLFQYIHNRKTRSPISLTTRLRIAYESAEALSYLHTSASPPIFHGDVKSSNILLNQNYTAMVSDFGASIIGPTNEEQFVTFVQGTCGYLDPEYIQSCKLTDKSDVYSFGVVLVELLTGMPVIDFDLPEEQRSLSSRFIFTMEENKLQELLDDEINNEDDKELIREVAELAMECLSMKGEERPIMKEVAEELHRIIKLKQNPSKEEYHSEEMATLLSVESRHDIEIEHSSYYYINADHEAEESIAIGR